MAAIPKDIQENMKTLSEKAGIPTKSLMLRLKEIFDTDETIKTMEKEDFKIRYAWARLYRENAGGGKAEDCYLTPLMRPHIREIINKKGGDKNFVGDVAALVQKIEKDENDNQKVGEVTYAAGTFWREGAKNAMKLEPGKVYKAQIIFKEGKQHGLIMNTDRASFMEVDIKMPSFKEYYDQKIKSRNIQIGLAELDLHTSDNATDIRTLVATVSNAVVTEKDGKESGRYEIFDDSISGSQFTIFVEPKDVTWCIGSILIFGGMISKDKDGKPRWNNQFVVPTDIAEPLKIMPKASTQRKEEVDIGEFDMGTPSAEKPKMEPVDETDFSV